MGHQGFFRRLFLNSIERKRGRSAAPPRKRLSTRNARLEPLEERWLMTVGTIPITFTLPGDLPPGGVYLEISATLNQDYTNKAGTHLTTGELVYYNATTSDYAAATSTSTFTFQLSGASVAIPDVYVTAGQIVIGIGSAPLVSYSAGGIAPPTPSTSPTNIYGLFEYANAAAGFDVDLSEIDQIGFPFTISTTPAATFPANNGVGIDLTRGNTFNQYSAYITSLGSNAAPFQELLTDGNGYRIVAPQNVFPIPESPVLGAPSYSNGGNLTPGATYYYWVTATAGAGHETEASNITIVTPYQLSLNGQNYAQATAHLTWAPYQGAKGYNIYRSSTNNSASAVLVGQVTSTAFTDAGVPQINGNHPPTSSYSFDPLNSYFVPAINNFFSEYLVNGQTFSIHRDGHLFTGHTVSYQEPSNGVWYTALVLTSTDFGTTPFVIFEPYFSTNTGNANLPAPPSWMQDPTQSPGQMLLAADGVFNTGPNKQGTGGQPGLTAAQGAILSDLENSIDSAFNRGIADNFTIAPDNWAAEPLLTSAAVSQTAGGNLAANTTYYYLITGINVIQPSGAYNESTASIALSATTTTTDKSITLTWNQSTAYAYNIYRSLSPDSGFQLITRVINTGGQVTSKTDAGFHQGTQTPPIYYAPGTLSNWYAAFLHQDSSIDTTSGVSINGLAYGFPYDDQGGQSTNMQSDFTAVGVTIQDWSGSPTPTPPTSNAVYEIKILTQPPATGGIVGGNTIVTVEARNYLKQPITGGVNLAIQVIGIQPGTYSVTTNATTGIATYSIKNTAAGNDVWQLQAPNGIAATTITYTVSTAPTSTLNGWALPFTTLQPSVQLLGPNALPATDVPNAASTSAFATTAIPWALPDGSINSLVGVTRSESLESSQLGFFTPLARAGHNTPPELLPPSSEDASPPTAQATDELEDSPEMVAMGV